MPRYDVVISFAGEDRDVAKSLADALTLRGLTVFYDEYASVELWGKDLYSHLTRVYRDESKYCLMVISNRYSEKQWTNHERRAAQARAISENREYILPLRLDDASVEGVLETTGYVDYRTTSAERIVEMLLEKVTSYNKTHGIEVEIMRLEDVCSRTGLGPKGKPPPRDSDFTTECPTCSDRQLASEATISLDGSDTLYTCKNGCQPIIVVSRPGLVAWPGRGYRLGDYSVRNAADLFLKTGDMAAAVRLPAAKARVIDRFSIKRARRVRGVSGSHLTSDCSGRPAARPAAEPPRYVARSDAPMVARCITLIVVGIIIVGCSDTTTPINHNSSSAPSVNPSADPKPDTHTHGAERVALDFIDAVRNDKYRSDVPEIPADAELPPQDRVAAFRMMERFIKSQEWDLWFTSIDVVDGKEDSADCYLRGADSGLLVLLLSYHYDVNEWRIGAYEIPDRTFARPKNESYTSYVARSISESKTGAKPFKDGVDGDGRYFIEYGRDG